MSQPEQLSPQGRQLLSRRNFMRNTGFSLGGLGLAHLLAAEDTQRAASSHKVPIRPTIIPDEPYAPRGGHFDGAAQQVLVIYCPGAVSHVDTFDYKPGLEKFHGQKPVSYTHLTLPTNREE